MRLYDAGKKDGPEVVQDRVLTIPNLLSFLRLLTLPIVYWDLTSGRLGRGLAIGFVFGSTDWLDGYLARRLDQVTRIGKLLDPISDRAFIVTVGAAMVVADLIPLWAVLVILARDVVVLMGGLLLMSRDVQPPPVTRIGKTATFGLMWSFPLFILAGIMGDGGADPHGGLRVAGWIVFIPNILLYYVAAGQYVRWTIPRLREGAPPS